MITNTQNIPATPPGVIGMWAIDNLKFMTLIIFIYSALRHQFSIIYCD